ncbi:PEP/pyruvate-binding domain-containing protein [Kribbella qitaiheensis]|uniref:PEP/pyruvate-binding domain-containing protein n=1 Tax=Kribbella qitaiheensis TaxID=1544730 RepID=UPI001FEA7B00|nr:PEP/pyruvate-binding domain-containing protein [Kribbella qitaiheensis]
MLISLLDATPQNAGAKAATLGRLATAGFPVPPGFVVPIASYESTVAHLDIPTVLAQRGPDEVRRLIESQAFPPQLLSELANALSSLGDLPVAVRSSATTEDTPHASAAGQHDTYLAIHGPAAVATKLLATWSSLWTTRAVRYRHTFAAAPGTDAPTPTTPATAVLIQRHIDADVAGVLFTASPGNSVHSASGQVSVIEASWGLGESVVQGSVTPDEYVASADGVLERRLGDKRTRIDRSPEGTTTTEVPAEARRRACLSDDQVVRLRKLGEDVAHYLGGPQDIEFAVEGDQFWLLQARPITAALATSPQKTLGQQIDDPSKGDAVERRGGAAESLVAAAGRSDLVLAGAAGLLLRGTGGSPGIATGPARVVNGPEDFAKVAVGDILICRYTDPAWTALFTVIAGVVTETGGRLSHAAIVARERRIPAVLGVPTILSSVQDGDLLTIDGSAGTVRAPRSSELSATRAHRFTARQRSKTCGGP